jgi:hypothetical protein
MLVPGVLRAPGGAPNFADGLAAVGRLKATLAELPQAVADVPDRTG